MLEEFAFQVGVLKVIDDDRFDRWEFVELLNCCLSVWPDVELLNCLWLKQEACKKQDSRWFKIEKMIFLWMRIIISLFTLSLSSFKTAQIGEINFTSPKIQKGAKKNPKCRIPASHQTITTSTCARYCTLKTQCVKVCQKIRLSSITTKCLFTNNAVNRLSRYFSISTQPTIQYTVTG